MTMIKNVTVRNSQGAVVLEAETMPSKEIEQKEFLKRFGPGKYKLSYQGKRATKDGGIVSGIVNRVVYVGDTMAPGGAARGSYMPNSGAGIDLSLYTHLLGPLVAKISEDLDFIKEKQTEIIDQFAIMQAEFFEDDTGEGEQDGAQPGGANPLAGIPGMKNFNMDQIPPELKQNLRFMEAIQKLQDGKPWRELLTEYADLLPLIMQIIGGGKQ